MNNNYLRRIYLRLAGAVTLVVMLALVANALLSQRTFEHALAPQLAAKVASVGASVRALVLRAVESGVDFRELYGVTERFDEIRSELPEVTYFALTDTRGVVHHQKGQAPEGAQNHFRSPEVLALLNRNEGPVPFKELGSLYIVSIPILAPTGAPGAPGASTGSATQGEPAHPGLGILHLGLSASVFDTLVLDMALDVVVVLVVSLFFTLELLHFIAGAKLEASLRELGATFARGAAGDFTARKRDRSGQSFGSLLDQLDLHLAQVNQQFVAAAREVENNRRGPAHERLPGLALAQMGLRALAQRCRFGVEHNPPRDREAQMAKVRAPLFMFILAEELTRSFLPGYIKDLLVPVPGLSPEIVIGLPIALFMLIVAVGQPFLGVYTERVGHRRAMLFGAAIAASGFLATTMAYTVLDLLLWRSLCALGYAMVFVAAQAYVLEHATPETRARSFALFVGAIMAATVCGPSIGGILADNLGSRPTFAIAAALAALSMLVIRSLPQGRDEADATRRAPARLPRWSEITALLRNPRFMAVTGLAAIPAKVLLTGLCFYLIPLYVVAQGSSQAMAGRILMTYAVVMVILGPLTAGLATNGPRMQWLVGGGLLVSGLGGVLMLGGSGVGLIFAAVALVGLGQSMSIAAQSALLSEHCATEIQQLGEGVVYGVYRLLERLGNAAGPMIAAGLALQFDQRTAFVAIGTGVCVCGLLFLVAVRQSAPEPRRARQPGRTDRVVPAPAHTRNALVTQEG